MPKLRVNRKPTKWDSYKLDFSDEDLDDPSLDNSVIDQSNSNSWCPKCVAQNESDDTIPDAERLPKNKVYCPSHLASQSQFPCSVQNCSRIFRSLSCLERHSLWHEGKKPFSCDKCKEGFSSLIALKEHQLKHSNEKPLGCPFCDQFFRHYSSLIRHKKTHFGKLSKAFTCNICNKNFTQKSYLKSHTLVHTQERKYICLQCPKKFLHPSDLKRHSKIHLNRPIKTHNCSQCPETFPALLDLNKHLEERHPQNLRLENETQLNNDINDNKVIHPVIMETFLPEQSSTFPEKNIDSQINKSPEISENNPFQTSHVTDFDKEEISLDFLQSHIDYAKFPDFKSQAYFDWLSSFASLCEYLIPPIESTLMNKITQVHKTLVDQVSGPMGIVHCKHNFLSLYNIVNVLQKTIIDHLKYVSQNLH